MNLLYFLFTLPLLIFVYVIFGNYILQLTGSEEFAMDFIPGLKIFAVPLISYIPQILHAPLVIISLICYGPATMGATFVYRNFAREEHAWVSDFFSKGLANFRQGVIFGIIDVALSISLVSTAIGGLMVDVEGDMMILSVAIKSLARIGLVVYAFARQYIFLQAVTIKLNVFQIIMNSLRFVLLGFWRNAIAVIADAAVIAVLILLYTPVTLLSLPFLFYSMSGFVAIFTVYPVVKKYIVDPIAAIEAENEENSETEEQPN
ncbi:MAG: hypothetical protein LBN43_09190 [Oscillospiraceae bacterium]|nr:hypothetical protein [Oscillospiraceae bacterium]